MRKVYIVANPAAGQDNLNVRELNVIYRAAGVDWDLGFTKGEGDATRLAREAAERGVDVVAAYGGDGTVAEVANGLLGTRVPLAIIPGGTANVMSVELGIPGNFLQACALLATEMLHLRRIDVGVVDGRHFLLRTSLGLEARMVEGADRNLKNRFGNLAYGLSALNALRKPQLYQYRFEMDGRTIEDEGIACIVANSGNLGLPGLRLASNIEVDDGLLDVIVVSSADMSGIISVISSMMGQQRPEQVLNSNQTSQPGIVRHWQAQQIRIEATPNDVVQCDGEMIGETPKEVSVLPGAVEVVVPLPVLADVALAGA
ncbi:MAG: diacylglycerol kinase family protein [Litorilinea sp.]